MAGEGGVFLSNVTKGTEHCKLLSKGTRDDVTGCKIADQLGRIYCCIYVSFSGSIGLWSLASKQG